jgi:hypothetical protein
MEEEDGLTPDELGEEEPELLPEEHLSPDGMGGNFIVTDGMVRGDSNPPPVTEGETLPFPPLRHMPSPDGGVFIVTG